MSAIDLLPPRAATALQAALASVNPGGPVIARNEYRNLKVTLAPAESGDQRERLDEAFTAVSFPRGEGPIPLPDELTPPQRALAELLARHVVAIGDWRIPRAAWVRRKWLGLDPPGATEEPVRHGGRVVPLWRALLELDDEDARAALLATLPLAKRLEAYGDFVLGAYGVSDIPPPDDAEYGDAGRAWAPRYADRLIDLFDGDSQHVERGEQTGVPDGVKMPLARALVDAGVPIEPRWDTLLPLWVHDDALPLTLRLLHALPAARRGPAILATMADMFDKQAVRTALTLLPRFPSVDVAQAVIDRSADVDGWPRRLILADLAAIAAHHPELDARVRPFIASLPPLVELTCGVVKHAKHQDELTHIERAQCAAGSSQIMGCGTDWVNDEEIGYLEVGSIHDAAGKPVYDFTIFMDEDGAIFRSGTAELVALLCQFALYCDDPSLKEALQMALAGKR